MKKFLVFIGILAIVGGVVCLVLVGLSGADWNFTVDDIYNYDTADRSQIDFFNLENDLPKVEIQTDLIDCSVLVKFADLGGAGVKLNYPDIDNTFSFLQTEDSVVINQSKKIDNDFSWLAYAFGKKDNRYIEITIDSKIADVTAYSITTIAGRVVFKNGNATDIVAKTDAGTVTVEHFTLSSLNIETSAGTVTLKDIVVAGNVQATASAGTINLNNVEGAIISLKTSAGMITAKDVTATQFDAQSTTGTISCNQLSALTVELSATAGSVSCNNLRNCDNLTISVQTGTISGSIYANKNEYTINASTKTGHCGISNQTAEGNKSITLKCNTGSISFSFKTD